MFDIGWQELFIVAVIAIIVVGPKDLPRALRTVTQFIRKARGMARDFQRSIDDVVREAELDDLRKQVESSADLNIRKEVENALDADGDFGDQFKDVQRDLDQAAKALKDDGEVPKPAVAPEPVGPPPPKAEPADGEPNPKADDQDRQKTG